MSEEYRSLIVNDREIELDREGNVYLAERTFSLIRLGKPITRHCQRRKLSPLKWDGTLKVKIKGNSYHIHRLMARAWLPNPENKPVVFHKDGNKHNNNLNNLIWLDYSELRDHINQIPEVLSG